MGTVQSISEMLEDLAAPHILLWQSIVKILSTVTGSL